MTKKHIVVASFLLILAAVILVVNTTDDNREIFLIAANPMPIHLSRSPSAVVFYKVDAEGLLPVQVFDDINMYVRPHPDRDMVLIHSGLTLEEDAVAYRFYVVNYDNASQAGELLLRACVGCDSHMFSYFMRIDDSDYHTVVTARADRQVGRPTIYDRFVDAVDLDTGEQKLLEYDDLKRAISFGSAGLVSGSDSVYQLYIQGNEVIRYWGDDIFYTGFRLPQEYVPLEQTQLIQVVNNEHIRVFSWYTSPPTPAPSKIVVYNKSTGTWSDFMVEGDRPLLRGFGSWIAGEMRFSTNFLQTSGYPESGDANISPPLAEADLSAEGTLYLYDTPRQQLITYATGSPDSQILHVENGVVYFRVEDELRKGRIRRGELDRVELVAKSDEIRGVHWMFLGHE